MGIAVTAAGLSSPPCLGGCQRLIVTPTKIPDAPPVVAAAPPEIYVEFTFRKVSEHPEPTIADCGCGPPGPHGFALSAGSAGGPSGEPGDRIVVRADLGSYRLRPICGVNVIAPAGVWEIAMWHSYDPCLDDETLWWTRLLPAGVFKPDPYYHLLRILSGTVAWQAMPLVLGFEMSMPGSGGNLTVGAGGAVVQLGFHI